MARVKEAFRLSENDTETLVAELWPQSVFPWELWGRAYDKFWRGVAASNAEMFKLNNPPYPEMIGIWANAHVNAWREKMYGFFSELGFALPALSLQKGLDYIIEETYEDSSIVFPAEREALFASLFEAERGFDWYRFHHIDTKKLDEMLNDKAFGTPKNNYHFISQLFNDTMVVDKRAAVRHLLMCECPFDHEVKGLTRRFVERVQAELEAENPIVLSPPVAQGTPSVPETPPPLDESTAENQPQEEGNIIRVPAALWEGRPPFAVRDAMRSEYGDAVIAYVLHNWCKVPKTTIGSLLWKEKRPGDKKPTDDKTFRNITNKLLEEAESLTIVKA